MSEGTSSGGAPADIIDLDRYMRAAVRPSRPTHTQRCEGGLVVDAGGVVARPPLSSGDSVPQPRHKRQSHDSGLSDGSYVYRRQRPHRRVSNSTKSKESSRRNGSSASMREFRAIYQKALLEQQQQIARVAELCERLTQHPVAPVAQNTSSGCHESQDPGGAGRRVSQDPGRSVPKRQRTVVVESSDITSSSRSTCTTSHRKYKPDSCKTYKIIMTKLDELSRVFAARRAVRPVLRPPPYPSPASVSDKVVATDTDCRGTLTGPAVQVIHKAEFKTSLSEAGGGVSAGRRVEEGEGRPLAVAVAHRFDIAPMKLKHRNNVHAESVVRRTGSSESEDVLYDLNTPDLNDPLRFYAEGKRLQALHATTKRGDVTGDAEGGSTRERRGPGSLCALCRAYWRSLRLRLTQHLFPS